VSEKQEQALRTVHNYMWWSGAAGLVPVPFVDLAAVSGVQLKMLADLSRIYGLDFSASRGKAAVGALLGSVVPHSLSFGTFGSLIKAIPGVGTLAGGPAMVMFSAATCWAVGNVFIQHFESGGTFLDFNPDAVREHFRTHYDDGRLKAGEKVKA